MKLLHLFLGSYLTTHPCTRWGQNGTLPNPVPFNAHTFGVVALNANVGPRPSILLLRVLDSLH